MKKFLQRLIKLFAYSVAGIVILLAIAVGLFRLFLPRLPEYQDEIKDWASQAIGMQVEFSGMDARWGLSGPELEFYETRLIRPDSQVPVIAAEEVRVGVGLIRLLVDRTLVVDRIVIRETSIDVRQLEDGSFRVQGSSLQDLLKLRSVSTDAPASVDVIGEQLELRFMQPDDERPHFFSVPRLRVSVDERRVAADAEVRLPDDLGNQLRFAATQLLGVPPAQRSWDISVDGDDISLAGWSELVPDERQFVSGVGDVELSLAYARDRIKSASVNFDLLDVSLSAEQVFDLAGRAEVDFSDDGWLVAANELNLSMPDHEWPETSLRVEASVDSDGRVVMLNASASYLLLDDTSVVRPWLTEKQREQLDSFAPSGVVRNLEATVSDIGQERTGFDINAELDDAGLGSAPGRPGLRGFTGLLRANQSGGLLEINSDGLVINAPELVADPIDIDIAEGTVIWRRGDDRTTILSDSIRLSSDILDSQSNVQLVLNADGSSPVIDLSSSWSISDIARAKRFIPAKIMKPKLYEWFQMALVSGSVPAGTTQLNGPLDKFPFDGGEGRLLVQSSVRDLTFKYHRDWPASRQADLEVVVDNARLYSVKNRSQNTGNRVVDAKINIPDLRDPVLKIESFSTGTLESIRRFSMSSPIARVFGGQLDRVSVSGDASFTLDLIVPLEKERLNEFEFVTTVRSNNGSLRVEGFDAPVTELSGDVTISRETISSEMLSGQFLGQPVKIELMRSPDPQYSVIAVANGTLTADGVVNDLGVPLEGLVAGAAPFEAKILFPNSKSDIVPPLTIQAASNLQGFALDLPEPVGKAAAASLLIRGDIRFLSDGSVIESAGSTDSQIAWNVAFNRPEDHWDFDRGMVTFGGEAMQPAATRGLHLRGSADVVRVQDWLSLSRSDARNVGAADRIRSIDVVVDNMYILGQHLRGHRARVDRSARDWLVQLEGADVVGSVFVPYDFGGDRAMVFDMQRLRLPGDDTASDEVTSIDPRRLPPISLKAAEFAFGDRNLGSVQAELKKTGMGLDAALIRSTDPTFEVVGNGRWVADENDPSGSHSYITASLTSKDVKQTMARLNYQPGIISESLNILFTLDWSGSPRAKFFDVLDGEVQVRLGDGRLVEVEPGAGRVFGLMSIVALPRRLSLDFRDVFNKGFGFDKITGSFRIVDGKTYTCDLSLEGPAADIGIVGEADLNNRTYAQTAIVSANVGNTLPIVGALAAGPQAAAALLIFSQIFKKPLQEVGQVYYGIDGSWDEPIVESANSEAFVTSGEHAGCLADPR